MTVTAFGLLCLASASQAFAVAITGNSAGSFSDLTGCDKKGSDRECGIVSNDTQVRWPYLDHNHQINYASSLTAVDIAVSEATDAFDVVIAQLDWFNAATDSDITPDSLGVTWTLSLNFSSPNSLIDTGAFGLNIFNTDNPAGDIISLPNLSALSFNLDGVTIDDFRYVVLDGSGRCDGVDTSLSGTSWYNCENNRASLFITADFTAPSAGTGGGAAVSEPATLALLWAQACSA